MLSNAIIYVNLVTKYSIMQPAIMNKAKENAYSYAHEYGLKHLVEHLHLVALLT